MSEVKVERQGSEWAKLWAVEVNVGEGENIEVVEDGFDDFG